MKNILMLCHDQDLDRRVVAQGTSLIEKGCRVSLLALSFNNETHVEVLSENFLVHRIGMNNIRPSNKIYKNYNKVQGKLYDILYDTASKVGGVKAIFLVKLFTLLSKSNWWLYKIALWLAYRNTKITDPLPFTSAFYDYGKDLDFVPQLIQVHDLPTLEAGVKLKSYFCVPLVYDAHELYPEQASFSNRQKKICSESERSSLKEVDLVFAVNRSIAKEMSIRYDIDAPIALHNSVSTPEGFDGKADKSLIRKQFGFQDHHIVVLFQGGFTPNRNLEKLVEAMRFVASDDIKLVLLGFGAFKVVLERIAKRHLLLNKSVFFMDAVPQNELIKYSASADWGVIPYPHVDLNTYYCTPNKLFEYIQAGLPIIANDSPELRHFVADNSFGSVFPMKSAKDIATAINEAINSGEAELFRENLAQNRSRFSWEVEKETYTCAMERFLLQ